jgi:hypothetical protein
MASSEKNQLVVGFKVDSEQHETSKTLLDIPESLAKRLVGPSGKASWADLGKDLEMPTLPGRDVSWWNERFERFYDS